MNSFNHYAYGAIGDWMYRVVTGIETDESGPGYKKIKIQPHIGKGLSSAASSLQTYYGELSSSWKTADGKLLFDVVVPANTTAVVHIPAKNADNVFENDKQLKDIKEIQITGAENGYVVVKIGSGKYNFVVK
jgi:alpha-L-rhamnosidase